MQNKAQKTLIYKGIVLDTSGTALKLVYRMFLPAMVVLAVGFGVSTAAGTGNATSEECDLVEECGEDAYVDSDPNFYIFICFGQSNMDGAGKIEKQDLDVDERFQVLAALDMPRLNRTKGQWYPAIPPLCRGTGGLGPADYFGRTLVANLPEHIRVGVVNVAIPGCKIELFEKDTFESYAATAPDWMTNFINQYGGNPYRHLVNMAQIAQKSGVIKGFLLHQGESNANDQQWPNKVKGVYDNLIKDLNLNPEEVPLLAGETVHADQQGVCAGMNTIIAKLPDTLDNSFVISSAGCESQPDRLHFSSSGNRELGKRYAEKMLTLLGYEKTNSAISTVH